MSVGFYGRTYLSVLPARRPPDAPAQEWCQVAEKDVPPEIPLTETLVVPELVTMVIGVGPEAPSVPPFTCELLKVTVPKFASGSTPLEDDGASAITSAEARASEELLWLIVWLQPRVLSARYSVNEPEEVAVTRETIVSPAFTVSLK
jgi:hypothetical protein